MQERGKLSIGSGRANFIHVCVDFRGGGGGSKVGRGWRGQTKSRGDPSAVQQWPTYNKFLEQIQFFALDDRLHAIFHGQLAVDIVDMGAQGAFGDKQLVGNFLVG